MEFHKLVRDKIPEMIEAQGEKALYKILDSAAFTHALEKKLDEEVAEYHANKEPEELADILEVVFALAEANGCTRDELLALYRTKNEKRGGFARRIFLIAKE